MDGLQPTQIHRAFTRPMLTQGAETQPFLALLMICLFLIVVVRVLWIAALGVGLFFAGRAALQRLAKSVDPQASAILLRHFRYRRAYPAQSTAWAERDAPRWWG